MDKVILQFPAKADFLLTARLTASSIGSRMGCHIDKLEDLKTAVSEACHIIMHEGKFSNLNIVFNLNHTNLGICVSGMDSGGEKPGIETDIEMSQYILDAMTKNLNINTDGSNAVHQVSFTIDAGEDGFF